jgi:selenocysteine lyase/cysteine desulfurase
VFLSQVIMIEGLSGEAVLARSAELVAGRWWNTLGRLLVVSARWRQREASLLPAVLDRLAAHPAVRLLGPGATGTGGLHRCPTVAFVPTDRHPEQIADELSRRRIMCSAGHFYAYRVLQGLGIDPERGVVRLSWVHYTSDGEMANLMTALDDVLGAGADLSPAAPR